ncbi:uncharacterized protein EI90DRAFT_2091656 [Cantharellus anzutake]|uniref:uncharacterized protein n=1 Tax=Cantharellus anzutake TaxID=1750568 RepID=UPI001905B629|nr:uncharacterized protein EI90DRAFT_2091656 [Cantharellus anzutake]KAF8340640.1 hypothetical protein EI90DRAFT_2091656 [Cantharellus anzutake]
MLFIDPVLESHLKDQAKDFIGSSLLDWVHPDERQNASVDLFDVVEKQAVHGTVTRIKLVRASQIRVELGSPIKDTFPHARQVGYDDLYIPCDVAVNWVGENLVLCFMHAVIDVSPARDNDERHKSHWTNWCGSVPLDKEHVSLLHERLFKADHYCPPHPQFPYPPHLASSPNLSPNPNPHSSSSSSSSAYGYTSPKRIFQVLQNTSQPSGGRKLLFGWPDEGYQPSDFGKLAQDVELTPQKNESSRGGGDYDDGVSSNGSYTLGNRDSSSDHVPQQQARTSCTRRYASLQTIQTGGMNKTVESIFIPHGGVIFTCHVVVEEKPIVVPSRFGMGMGVYLPPANITVQPPPIHNPPIVPHHPSITTTITTAQNHHNHMALSPMGTGVGTGVYHGAGSDDVAVGYRNQQHHHHQGSSYPSQHLNPHSYQNSHRHHSSLVMEEQPPYPYTSVAPASTLLSPVQDQYPLSTSPSISFSNSTAGAGSVTRTGRQHHRNNNGGGTVDWTSKAQGRIARAEYDIHPYPPRGTGFSPSTTLSGGGRGPSSPGGSSSTSSSSKEGRGSASPGGGRRKMGLPSLRYSWSVDGATKGGIVGNGHAHSHNTRRNSSTGIGGGATAYGQSHSAGGGAGAGITTAMTGTTTTTTTITSASVSRGGNPPNGVMRCAFCGTTSSPEWRKGTTGIKNLCNACGLRYARTKQKEEGYIPSRRRPANNSQVITGAASGSAASVLSSGSAGGMSGGSSKVAKRAEGMTPRGTLVEQEAAKAFEDAIANASAIPGVGVGLKVPMEEDMAKKSESLAISLLSSVGEGQIGNGGNGVVGGEGGVRLPPISLLETSRDN